MTHGLRPPPGHQWTNHGSPAESASERICPRYLTASGRKPRSYAHGSRPHPDRDSLDPRSLTASGPCLRVQRVDHWPMCPTRSLSWCRGKCDLPRAPRKKASTTGRCLFPPICREIRLRPRLPRNPITCSRLVILPGAASVENHRSAQTVTARLPGTYPNRYRTPRLPDAHCAAEESVDPKADAPFCSSSLWNARGP